MLKKTIKYTNFNGEVVSTDCYFHLSVPELVEMQFSVDGGLEKMITQMIDENDQGKILEMAKRFVLDAYGVKSPDGERFEKTPELRKAFSETAAYEALYLELAFDADAMAEFVNGMLPADAMRQVEERTKALEQMQDNAAQAAGTPTQDPSGYLSQPTQPQQGTQAPWSLPPSGDQPQPPPPPVVGNPPPPSR